jgi:hypothetical protein
MAKTFARWMRKTTLREEDLCNAVIEMASGLVDADLGGHVLKKRLAVPGRGRRSGARVLIGTNLGDRWFFLFGFEKNERDDINDDELATLQGMASRLLDLSESHLATDLGLGSLREICNETKPHPH